MRCFVIEEYYCSSQSYARVHVAFSEKFEQEVSDRQIKCIVDQFEKNHMVSDMPRSGRAHPYKRVFKPFEALSLSS